MKSLYMKVFAAILFCCISSIGIARTYQPNGTSSFTGSASYCIGAAAAPLTFTYTTCNAGGGVSVGGACTISWYTNTTNSTALGTATLVSGPTAFNSATAATGSQAFTPSTATAGVLYYFCVITLSSGGCAGFAGTTITSATTQMITIDPLPAIYNVTGGGNVCAGSAGAFVNLSFSDVGVNYQLFNGAVLVATLPGALSSLSFGPENAAGTYTIFATNTSTTCTNNMNGSATITVLPAPTQFTVTGGGGYCAGGAGVDIGLNGSVAGTNYQLYNGAATVGPVKSGTGAALDFGIQFTAGTYSVLATITATGCTGGMLNTVPVVVNPLPNVYTVGGGGAYCQGGAGVEITLSNSDVGVNYQLYNGAVATGAPVAGTGVPPLDMGMQTAAGTYTVFATNAGTGCTNNMSGSASVIVSPLPTLYTMTGGGGYCAGGLGVAVGLSGSQVGVNYQLYDGVVPVSGMVPGTGAALNFGLQTAAGNYTVVAENAVTLCTSTMTGVAIVIVNPLPNVYTISAGGSYCAGGPGVDLTLSGSDVGVNYQVYNGVTATGAPIAGTGLTPTDLGFFTAAGTYTVLATNATTFCMNNMAGSATIVINPLPTVFPVTGGGHYCAGGTGVHVGLGNSQVGVSYQLYNGAALMGTLAGTGAALDFGLETVAGTYTVLATNTTTFCTNNMSGSAIVVIDPLPNVYTVTGGGPYCAGGTGVHVGLSGSDVGVNYQLYDGAALMTVVAGTGAALDFGLETAAGTYTVLAVNAATGCTNNMTGNAIITVNPLPTVYTVMGGGSYCAGGTGVDVSLSWSDLGVNYQLYLDGAPYLGPYAGTGTALDFGLLTGAGNYLVVATNTATGCLNLMSGSATIVVNPAPAPISGTTTICVNATSALTDATAGGAWSSNNVAVATIDATGLMTGVASGVTTITYTLPTTCYATVPVNINPLPVVTAISGITNECVGFGNTLNDATATGVWSSTNTAVATIDPVTGMVNGVAAGIVTISYTVTNAFGCVAAATTPDTVNAFPVVASINGPANICINIPVTLSDDTTGGVWASSDITVATIDPMSGSITGVAAGTLTVTYTVTNAGGCATFVTAGETVNPSPAVTAINGDTSVCAGLTIALNDTTAGGTWSSSDVTVATVNSTGTVTGVAVGIASVSYTVTNVFGCANSAIANITVGNAMPAVAIAPGTSATLCNGTPINLVVTPVSGGLTYQWSLNGADIAGATNGSYIADTNGLFTVTLNNGTCSATLAGTNVLLPPHPIISYNSAGNYLYTSAYATYQWYKNGTPITGANSSTLPVTGAGLYKVVVSDANGCYVASAPYNITGGGGGGGGGGGSAVKNTPQETDLKVFPNPAASTLWIVAPVTVNVSVISPDGKVVIEQKQATSIDVSQLAGGLYIIMIYDENSTLLKTEKFVKIK